MPLVFSAFCLRDFSVGVNLACQDGCGLFSRWLLLLGGSPILYGGKRVGEGCVGTNPK
jgi:hypothetical protein